jgi:hypothetical protein
MKNILILFLATIVLFSCEVKKTYCGKVTEKYLLHKNEGGTHHVVYYCDSLHKFIDVSVTTSCYVNTKLGDRVCFKLYNFELEY